MKHIIDLPPFPENLGEKRVLNHARVKVQTWDGNHSNGKLFEFNGPARKVVFTKPDGGFGKVDFDAIRLVSFVDTMEPGREMDHNDDARLEFTDGSIWEGHVHYYLNDHHGLHFLAPTRTGPHRFFVPWSSVKDYRFGPLLGEILIRECGLTREDINKAAVTSFLARCTLIAPLDRSADSWIWGSSPTCWHRPF